MWWSSGAGEAEGRPQSQEGSLRREGERDDQNDQSDQVIIKWEW